jgi:hypothetical protein
MQTAINVGAWSFIRQNLAEWDLVIVNKGLLMSIDATLLLHSENIPFVKEYHVEDGGKKIAQ